MRNARWLRLLAYVTGSVNPELLARNEYLAAENRILRAKPPSRLRLSNSERTTLAEIGKRLGRKALREVASIAKPDTILAWYRRLIARKFDCSRQRQNSGRPEGAGKTGLRKSGNPGSDFQGRMGSVETLSLVFRAIHSPPFSQLFIW